MSDDILKIAFYKGDGLLRDRFIRRWTKSKYSHVELVIESKGWWLGIRPPDYPVVRKNIMHICNDDDWDFIEIPVSKDEVDKIIQFYNKTSGMGYDWIGMILSHVSRFKVKHTKRWYCSEWVIYALEHAGIFSGMLYDKNRLPPSDIYKLLLKYVHNSKNSMRYSAF